MEKYHIELNRKQIKEERHKGVNCCKDNIQAFYDHKKGLLFPKIDEMD